MVETTFNIKNSDIADLFNKDLITMEDIVDKLLEQDDKIQELEYENEDLRDELRSQEQIKEASIHLRVHMKYMVLVKEILFRRLDYGLYKYEYL